MLTKKLTLTALFGYLCCCSSTAQAPDSLLLRNYQFVKQCDPWFTLQNTAALTRFATANIAEAELSLTKGNGGLTNFYESPNTLQAGAVVEAFYRLNRRTVVHGAISYDNYTGRDMTGSAFIHTLPATYSNITERRLPFDIVEDSLTTPGRKHRDTYYLTGAVGFDLYRGISIGARLDYIAANYAKYKDLRHKNKLMDLTVSAGIYAPMADWLNIGANYTYHRSTESVNFGTYGKSDKIYKSLIDYGAFTGLTEQFGNEGYTDKSREMPLFEDSHGGAFQIEVRPTASLAVFAGVTHSRGDGYYGRKSPYTITYTGHKRHTTTVQGRLTYSPHAKADSYAASTSTSRFTLDAQYTNERLAAHAETYRDMTNASSATYYEYYDPVETGDKQWDDIMLCATAQLGIKGELPTWEISADYHWAERKQVAYLFPFYRHQRLTTNVLTASATRNMLFRRGVLSCSLTAGYQKGSGTPYEDYSFDTSGNSQQQIATMEAFLYREYQYLTATQYRLGAGVKYAFLFPGTQLKTHVRVSADYRTATEACAYSRGSSHTALTVAMGCTF